MPISRAQLLKELLPGLNALFGLEYARYDDEHADLYETESSSRSFEEEVKLSGFDAAPVKDEGSAISYDAAQESFTARYTKALARAMAHTKQVKAVFPLNNGFTNAYQGGDGVNLFTASGDGVTGGDGHPLVSGGKNSNRPSTAVDLNETSLEAAVIQIGKWTDERGLLIASRPQKLVIPPDLQFVATRVMKSELRPGTADNDINAVRSMGVVPGGTVVNHFLTDTDAWFLLTDVPDGMKHFNRVALETSMDGDFDTGNVRYKARERYSFGVSDPLGIWGSPGA